MQSTITLRRDLRVAGRRVEDVLGDRGSRRVLEARLEAYAAALGRYRFAMENLLHVPPGAFTPPPKVDSAVVRMVPLGADRLRAKDDVLFGRIVAAAFDALDESTKQTATIPLWDGRTADRIVDELLKASR